MAASRSSSYYSRTPEVLVFESKPSGFSRSQGLRRAQRPPSACQRRRARVAVAGGPRRREGEVRGLRGGGGAWVVPPMRVTTCWVDLHKLGLASPLSLRMRLGFYPATHGCMTPLSSTLAFPSEFAPAQLAWRGLVGLRARPFRDSASRPSASSVSVLVSVSALASLAVPVLGR